MPCANPLYAYYKPGESEKVHFLKRTAVDALIKHNALHKHPNIIQLPCGHCMLCRIRRRDEWSLRIMHESQLHTNNQFVTLTYDNDHINPDMSLHQDDVQKFLKRLRKRYRFRYYYVGEYGEKYERPHYHIILFGIDFLDKQLWSIRAGYRYYRSPELESVWQKGMCVIGDLSLQSARYVSGYVQKKLYGKAASLYEEKGILPEYSRMSLKPAIGKEWFEKYGRELFRRGFAVDQKGQKKPIPRYYDKLYERLTEVDSTLPKLEEVKETRIQSMLTALDKEYESNIHEIARIAAKNYCAFLRQKNVKRSYESA